GGLALELAHRADVEVVGVTLSREQLNAARRRAADAGLSARVRFELLDWRHVEGRYDRIVSVGMFEHVGATHYREFFEHVRDLLAPDGAALLHSIGRSNGPGDTNPWMRKYIFPGGYSPALSEVLSAVEASGLFATDIEILRGHYARTIAEWQRRFQANRGEIAKLYNERFCRMWEFYLTGAEMAFRHQGHMVFQLQLTRDPEAVPLTRDYMVEAERGMAMEEQRAAE
ncbi:MAG TPA: cyclopropane-fatty-acyl-phospholipid synthase family protein, partial [Candidatus Omnitrophota bacterium]|nr:cyclopropane-fatty-acyl-phospholipid synthase family protein [Candidatus Omnitrophota bacterium]